MFVEKVIGFGNGSVIDGNGTLGRQALGEGRSFSLGYYIVRLTMDEQPRCWARRKK